jgi:hypothetical protein
LKRVESSLQTPHSRHRELWMPEVQLVVTDRGGDPSGGVYA